MRTKFNPDGTSVLQIDIESTKPTRGIYEVDEIEEFTVNEPTSPKTAPSHEAYRRESSSSTSSSEFRQVIDINSVHTVKENNDATSHPAIATTNTFIDKKFVKVEVNKTLGTATDLLKAARRIENVLDDDFDKSQRQAYVSRKLD